MTILIKLENYYRGCGIWPAAGGDFRCRHLDACRNGMKFTPPDATKLCQARDTFTPGHSAFVAARYEDVFPRLLFVGLDLGTVLRDDDEGYTYVKPETRTPLGLRASHERMMALFESGNNKARRPTLQRTNDLACAILRNFDGIPKDEHPMRLYARANASKCTLNKPKRRQADSRLYSNCRDYLRGEIDALAPDIVVSLGGKARDGVKRAFRGECAEVCQNAWEIRPENGKRMFWLHAHHPSSFGGPKFKSQMEGRDGGPGLDGYIRMIHEFIRARDGS